MLKEFDLDAPTLSKWSRHDFRNQTRCVTALYERLFKPFYIQQKAWKVLVEVVPVITKAHVRDLLGALTIQVIGNPEHFLEAPESSKRQIALDWLAIGAAEVATAYQWPQQPFRDTKMSVIAADFINKWSWKINIWNKCKTLRCDIEVDHGILETKIIALFKNRKGVVIGSSLLYSALPDEFIFVPLLGKLMWIDEFRIELVSKNGISKLSAVAPRGGNQM